MALNAKLRKSVNNLKKAIKQYKSMSADDREMGFLTISKAFEVAVEYGWRELKQKVENEGLEALSPKDAVRQSAQIGIIKKPQAWLESIDARNNSVHDYFGIGEKEFVELAEKFVDLVKGLLQ